MKSELEKLKKNINDLKITTQELDNLVNNNERGAIMSQQIIECKCSNSRCKGMQYIDKHLYYCTVCGRVYNSDFDHWFEEHIGKIEESDKKDDDNDFIIYRNYFITDNMPEVDEFYFDTITFTECTDFNCFEKQEHADLWGKKINAQLKYWHITQHINKGWKPEIGKEYYTINWLQEIQADCVEEYYEEYDTIYFKTYEDAHKARDMMGDDLKFVSMRIE